MIQTTALTLLLPLMSLLFVACLGYHLLWRVPLQDGSLKAIVEVKRSKRFANGTRLRVVYTGHKGLDEWLLTPVIFYEGLLDRPKLPHLLMLLDVHLSMQTTATVMLVQLAAVHRLPGPLVAA